MKNTILLLLYLFAMNAIGQFFHNQSYYRKEYHKLTGNVKSLAQSCYKPKENSKKIVAAELYCGWRDCYQVFFKKNGYLEKENSTTAPASSHDRFAMARVMSFRGIKTTNTTGVTI